MNKIFYKAGAVAAMWAFPLLTFAQGKTLKDVIGTVIGYFQVFITLIIGLAILTFIWNIYNYFFKADVENKKEAGLYVLYSTIGFFIILSFWGLVAILSNTLNLPNTQPMWPFGATTGQSGSQFVPTGTSGGFAPQSYDEAVRGNGGSFVPTGTSGGSGSGSFVPTGTSGGSGGGAAPSSYDEAVGGVQSPQDYDDAVRRQ